MAKTKHTESKIQIACVNWFRKEYPEYSKLLFSVPNGGKRGLIEATIMKKEGIISGVSDLILFIPAQGFHALCIEMKAPEGKQRESQKEWAALVQEKGYKYIICKSVEEFQTQIKDYLL